MKRSRTLSNTREVEQHPTTARSTSHTHQHQQEQQQHYEEINQQQQQHYDESDINDDDEEQQHQHQQQHHQQQQQQQQLMEEAEGAAIVRNIASFLTLSDAASMASIVLLDTESNVNNGGVNHHHHHHYHHHDVMMNINNNNNNNISESSSSSRRRRRGSGTTGSGIGSGNDGDPDNNILIVDSSWAVGEEIDPYHWGIDDDDENDDVDTPLTPALVALSPGATPHHSASHRHHHHRHQHHHDHHGVYEADHAAGLFYGNTVDLDNEKHLPSLEHSDSFDSDDDDGNDDYVDNNNNNSSRNSIDSPYGMQEILIARRRKWAQEKLAAAVYSHPGSLRSFCLQAYQAAQEIKVQQAAQHEKGDGNGSARLLLSSTTKNSSRQQRQQPMPRCKLLQQLMDLVLHNMPLTLFIDVLEAVGETYVESIFASFRLCQKSINAIVSALGHLMARIWDGIYNFNPFQLLEVIVSLQFNAMGRTSEVLVGGIQSVATGVGSASSLALHRLSAANLSVSVSSASLLGGGGCGGMGMGGGGGGDGSLRGNYNRNNSDYSGQHHHHHRSARNNQLVLNKKLLKKLSSINDAARVVKYTEMGDDTGGLTKQARTKVQRMMHYDVSLRPFVATVEKSSNITAAMVPPSSPLRGSSSFEQQQQQQQQLSHRKNSNGSSSSLTEGHHSIENGSNHGGGGGDNSSPSNGTVGGASTGSPFMCSPQSFPPTPHSRATLIARGNKFADDIVFLARDQLRLHGNLASDNEKTREMSKLLREGKRLAVFNAKDAANGIDFSCGQHIARKAGNMLYCSTRSMVPVLRNCFVYFEITVLPRAGGPGGGDSNLNIVLQPPSHMTTLSIGLSTSEMPPNTLVGAWQGSVGLCTTGQLLTAGQWCAPCANPSLCAYGDSATVGCLVCLDDGSAVDTWEGLLVTALVTFNVNGVIVAPPVANMLPIPGASAALPPAVVTSHHHQHLVHAQRHGYHGMSPPTTAKSASTSSTSSSPCHSPALHHRTTLPVLVPAAEELYPTVTLHSPSTAVMCRFSAEDIVAESRLTIGAPEGVTVYAVDGSVLFGGGGDSS